MENTQNQVLTAQDSKIKVPKGLKDTDLAGILFPVEVRNTPIPSNKEYSKQVIGQINGGDFLLNCCSDVYELADNRLIFPNIEQLLHEFGIEFEASYFQIDNVRFYAHLAITDKRYAYVISGTNDVIQPMLRVQHSYNGKTKFRIHFGYFRLICSNGLTIPLAEMSDFNLSIGGKHTVSIQSSLEDLKNMIAFFAENAIEITGAISAKFEQLANQFPVVVSDRIESVLKAAGITPITNNKFNTYDYILDVIKGEMNTFGLTATSDWLIYNAINHYINNNDLNVKTPEVREELDTKVIEFLLQK